MPFVVNVSATAPPPTARQGLAKLPPPIALLELSEQRDREQCSSSAGRVHSPEGVAFNTIFGMFAGVPSVSTPLNCGSNQTAWFCAPEET